MITKVSQEGNLSLVNLELLFRRNDLSFIKLGQWSKEWQFISMSNAQMQIALSESGKRCLDLWQQRWLKPRRNLVRCLITLIVKQLYVLLGVGVIFRVLFKKIIKLSEFGIDLPRLFNLIITEGKNSFWVLNENGVFF